MLHLGHVDPLEQGVIIPSQVLVFRKQSGWELFRVTHQNNSSRVQVKWQEGSQLRTLARFIDDQIVNHWWVIRISNTEGIGRDCREDHIVFCDQFVLQSLFARDRSNILAASFECFNFPGELQDSQATIVLNKLKFLAYFVVVRDQLTIAMCQELAVQV